MEFKEGMKLATVTLQSEEEKEVWYAALYQHSSYPHTHATEIVVVMVPGQMANTPWAKVTLKTGGVKMVNLARCDEVDLMPKEASNGEG